MFARYPHSTQHILLKGGKNQSSFPEFKLVSLTPYVFLGSKKSDFFCYGLNYVQTKDVKIITSDSSEHELILNWCD